MNALTRWFREFGVKPPVERRESPRAPFTGPIYVRTADGATFRGGARNLSTYGMGALLYAELKVGDAVVIYYSHPTPTACRFVCRAGFVRWHDESHYGFEFKQPFSE